MFKNGSKGSEKEKTEFLITEFLKKKKEISKQTKQIMCTFINKKKIPFSSCIIRYKLDYNFHRRIVINPTPCL